MPLLTPVKDLFISNHAVDEFLAYVRKNRQKHAEKPMVGKRKYHNKQLLIAILSSIVIRYHILRLLFEIKQMLLDHQLKVYLSGWEREVLAEIRAEARSEVSSFLLPWMFINIRYRRNFNNW